MPQTGRSRVTRRRMLRLSIFVLSASLTLIGRPPSAAASNGVDQCWNINLTRLAGQFPPDGTAFAGYYAHLDPQTQYLCTTQQVGPRYGSFSFAAVQIDFDDCPACDWGIVQIGRGACRSSETPLTCPGAQQQLFVAYGRDEEANGCTGLHDILPVAINRGAAPTDTGLHYYRVWTDGSRWRYDHWPKGQALVPIFDIAASLVCWTDRDGTTFNEAWDPGDSLGGHSANHYNFLSMTRQQTIGGPWSASTTSACGFSQFHLDSDRCQWNASQSWEAWNIR
jgi:hypothetical protein